MPAASVVFSLLTFFRPVKKASRLSVREPTVLKDYMMKKETIETVESRIDKCHTFCASANKK